LLKLWQVGGRMCGKLLAPVIPDLLQALERHGERTVSPEVRLQLLAVSPATIDRLLQRYKRSGLRQPRLHKPRTTGLKSQVPIRTWSEWSGVKPGSLQADLVLHCGESTEGFYLTSLCAVGVASGWTELQPVWGMGKERVGAAIHHVRRRLPFELKAIHTDNGSEFINHTLFSWCKREKRGFTRGRGYRKNDQA
jgi:transposase InsO family protein